MSSSEFEPSGGDVVEALLATADAHLAAGRRVFRFSLYAGPEQHTRVVVSAVHRLMWAEGRPAESSPNVTWVGTISEVLRRLGVARIADPRELNRIAGHVSRILRLNGLAIQIRHREWAVAPWQPGPIRTRGNTPLDEARLWTVGLEAQPSAQLEALPSDTGLGEAISSADAPAISVSRWLRKMVEVIVGRSPRGRHVRTPGSRSRGADSR